MEVRSQYITPICIASALVSVWAIQQLSVTTATVITLLAFGLIVVLLRLPKPEKQLSRELEDLQNTLKTTRASEQLYKGFFDNATDIVFSVDLKGRFRHGNDSIFEVAGYTREEGLNLNWNQLVAPHEWQKAARIYQDHANGNESLNFELDLVAKDGSLRTVDITSRPMRHHTKIIGFHGTARDVSKRRKTERSLQETLDRAEDAERAKTQLLARVSHEIRTPLHGLAGLISEIDTSRLSGKDQELVQPITSSVNHLAHLVDDVLSLAHLESGGLDTSEVTFTPAGLIKACVARHKHAADRKSLKLKLNLAPELPDRINGDATKTTQILDNLITNAIRYTPDGEVKVEVGIDSTDSGISYLLFRVEDTGPGIPDEKVDQIFEPFERLEENNSSVSEGVGLGLSITRQLVETLGGTISAGNNKDRGAHFRVSLPVEVASDRKRTRQFDTGYVEKNLKALIIEDDDSSRLLMESALETLGISHEEEPDKNFSSRDFENRRFDIALIDQHLPTHSGIEIAAQIKQLTAFKDCHFICITGDPAVSKQPGFDKAFDALLLKPCSQKDIKHLLADLLSVQGKDELLTLDETAGIELASGCRETWRKALCVFQENVEPLMQEIQTAYQNSDLETLKAKTHKLAGSARFIGAQQVADVAAQLNHACKKQRLESVEILVEELEQGIKNLTSSINKELNP